MNIAQKEEQQNNLLKRKEYQLSITFEGATPSKKDLQAQLSKELKAKAELSVVKLVDTSYGNEAAEVLYYVYEDADTMKRVEGYTLHKKIVEKIKAEEEKAAQEAEAAKEAAPEAPTEEPKEEPAEEKAEAAEEKEEVQEEPKAEEEDGKKGNEE